MINRSLRKCLSNGISMSNRRQIIVDVIKNSEDHLYVGQLYRRADEVDTLISSATVYRAVKLQEDAGFSDRLEFGHSRARYEESF